MKRLPYLVGNIGILVAAGLLFGISGLVSHLYPQIGDGMLFFCAILGFGPLLYAFMFSLRRLVDIGFHSWDTAGVAMLAVGMMENGLTNTHPLLGRGLTGLYSVLLLIAPTGTMSKKGPPPQTS